MITSKLATTVSTPVLKDWMEALEKDKYFGPIIRMLRNGLTSKKALRKAEVFEITTNQLLFTKKGIKKICVPKALQLETMKTAHDERCGGHMCIAKTQTSLQKTHWCLEFGETLRNT